MIRSPHVLERTAEYLLLWFISDRNKIFWILRENVLQCNYCSFDKICLTKIDFYHSIAIGSSRFHQIFIFNGSY